MVDTTEIRTRDLRARTPTRLPLRFLTPPTGVQADQAEKKTSPRNDGPTEIRTRDPRVRSPTLYRYATPPTPEEIFHLVPYSLMQKWLQLAQNALERQSGEAGKNGSNTAHSLKDLSNF